MYATLISSKLNFSIYQQIILCFDTIIVEDMLSEGLELEEHECQFVDWLFDKTRNYTNISLIKWNIYKLLLRDIDVTSVFGSGLLNVPWEYISL